MANVVEGMAIGLVCEGCGQYMGAAMITPQPETLKTGCVKCVSAAMRDALGDKPATNAEEWGEVFKRLKKR